MSLPLADRRILLAVTGGIAAYKAADLVSRLRKAGASVRVAMTRSATQFVAPLTFESLSGGPVYLDIFNPASGEMEHIGWARWAEAMVIAPATANTLARLAHGFADDAVTTLALACTAPVWVAPAMNTAMLQHPATQANITTLRSRGVRLIEPGAGLLACGEVGPGRMAEPADIVATLAAALGAGDPPAVATPAPSTPAGPLAGRTVLVTAGPTREPLDPIRFLSNRSSGRMGVELAAEAAARGARVLLVHGPLSVPVPDGVEAIPAETARAMLAATQARWPEVDVAVFAAAVANFEAPASDRKIKESDRLVIELARTPDIAAWCGANRREGQLLVGFAAETHDLIESARAKLARKRLDLICANQIGEPGLGFAADDNRVTLLDRDGTDEQSPVLPKRRLAGWIWDRLEARLATRV